MVNSIQIVHPTSNVQPLYDHRAKVTITYTPSTSDAWEIHTQPVEKSITNLAPSALLIKH
jgi:hypothetical protein